MVVGAACPHLIFVGLPRNYPPRFKTRLIGWTGLAPPASEQARRRDVQSRGRDLVSECRYLPIQQPELAHPTMNGLGRGRARKGPTNVRRGERRRPCSKVNAWRARTARCLPHSRAERASRALLTTQRSAIPQGMCVGGGANAARGSTQPTLRHQAAESRLALESARTAPASALQRAVYRHGVLRTDHALNIEW